ncbi:MAG: hypothetical protein KGY75_04715 [Candidatus Cloacimonetes bacterium]|nr:hypothetical protein [Candidatus Cloacimonadota bacterium]
MKKIISVLLLILLLIAGCAKLNEPAAKAQILNLEYLYPAEGYAMDTYVTDEYVYIAEDQAGFSIHDRNADTLITRFYGDIENARLIQAVEEDSTLFVYDVYGSPAAIMVYDIRDYNNPQTKPNITGQTGGIEDFICHLSDSNEMQVIWTHDNKIRFGTYNDIWMGSFSYNLPNAVKGFDYDSTYYYITGDERGVYVLNRNTGELVADIDTPGKARDVKLHNNFLYVAAREVGLQVIDISDPLAPALVYQYDTSGYAQGIDAAGNYLAVASGGGGIYLFDIYNPAKPQYKDRIDNQIIGYTYDVVVKGTTLFVATRFGVHKIFIQY